MAENSSAERKKRRGPGRPFKPGKSGNPGGRPKAITELREMAREHSAAAIKTLTAALDSEDDRVRIVAAVVTCSPS